jgi:hypothetical protein
VRAVWAVARLELREWRALPVLSLAAGCLGLLAARLASSASVLEFARVIPELCLLLASLTAGASLFTRDVREGRAEFLLTRPVAISAIWAGKLVAALLLAGATYLLSALPVYAWARTIPQPTASSGMHAVIFTLLFVGLGHWVALAFCARGLRLLADAVVTVSLLGVGGWFAQKLWFASASWSAGVLSAAWAGVLLLASLAAWAKGRGRRSPSYAAFTGVHWIGMGVVVAALGVHLKVVRSASPSSLRVALIENVSSDGQWLSVQGKAPWQSRGMTSTTLVTSSAGRGFVNLGLDAFWGTAIDPDFSLDGRWCAWSALEWNITDEMRPVVRFVELGAGVRPRSRWTPMPAGSSADAVVRPRLSPTGRAVLLVYGKGHIEILATDERGKLWSKDGVDSSGFLDDETVWVVQRGPGGREFATYGMEKGDQRRVVRLGGNAPSNLQLAPSHAYGLALSGESPAVVLERCNLVDGGCHPLWSPLAAAPDKFTSENIAEAGFLEDGGFVVAALPAGEPAWQLRAFEADGRLRWTLDVGATRQGPTLVGEPAPGRLFVHLKTLPGAGQDKALGLPMIVVDTAKGVILRTEAGLTPGRFTMEWQPLFRRGRAATFFVERSGAVVRLDPETGQRVRVSLP